MTGRADIEGENRHGLPMGVSVHKGRLFFASMHQRGSNWLLHLFAAIGFRPAAERLRERHVREWLRENQDIVEVKK